ncbi:MAG TPA: hypothetical protein VK335_14295 [Bryobacteraceae bacterium]|nr:hypothetical protein [Bryobacteraceae bacterium]
MTKSIFRICTILALSSVASLTVVSAQDRHSPEGVWDVSVTVTNCQTGALIRTVRSIQGFLHDGSFTESANTFLRGASVGAWTRNGDSTSAAKFWFFRYKPDGTFASFAQALDMITVSEDGTEFTAQGTIQDFDTNNVSLSIGCFTHTAKRLSFPGDFN